MIEMPPLLGRSKPLFFAGILSFLLTAPLLASPLQETPPRSQEGHADSISQSTVENLRAFTKLYGYVRYFHPSDAASEIDWARFAIHGVRQVKDASHPDELSARLATLFAPIAPTVQLYPTGDAPPPASDVLTPADTSGLDLVAWQHRGVDLGSRAPYQSMRLNRTDDTSSAETSSRAVAQVVQMIDPTPYHGKEVKVRAAAKAESEAGQTYLWLYADDPRQPSTSPEELLDRPIASSDWNTYERTATVDSNAQQITFGGFMQGAGKAWFDDFTLLVRDDRDDDWAEVPIANGGFEDGVVDKKPDGWMTGSPPSDQVSMDITTSDEAAHEGEQAVRLTLSIAEGLFAARPTPGEVVNKPLGRGLSAQVPLALYSDSARTLRPTDAPTPDDLLSTLDGIRIEALTASDEALRFADVIIAWNVLQHFYPYFDVVDVDWDEVLTRTLQRAASDTSPDEFLQTLRWMVAQLDDGHGNVYHPSEDDVGMPFRVGWIEDAVVVTAVRDLSDTDVEPCVRRGDVVASIDGTPAEKAVEQAKRYISGSPQWKTYRALLDFGRGEAGTRADLVLEREGRRVTCTVPRNPELADRPWHEPTRPAPIEEIERDIYYVDLTRTDMNALQERIGTLAAARGVVFDMRGYPPPRNGNQRILQHLSKRPLRSARWQKPQIIYPDRENVVGYDTTGRWTLPPATPAFSGEVAFLTDARALSYAESIMGIVEHYALGEIVGRPTAGVNGNANPFTLPGGYRVTWTGMRVVKHDGTQHHLVGIEPAVPVERTIAGVREGRDEDLEQALNVIRASEGHEPDK